MPNHPNHYENYEEAKLRLEGCVVTYDKTPCYIRRVEDHDDGIVRLKIVMLPNTLNVDRFEPDEDDQLAVGGIRKKINSPKFNRFRPFEMGYCNNFTDTGHVKFLSRIPVRRSKQGLSQESLSIKSNRTGHRPDVNYRMIVECSSFRDCVAGDYPDFEEVMDTLVADSSIGVDRSFSVERDNLGLNFLYHNCEKVGLVQAGEIRLARQFDYLREKIIASPKLPNIVVNL
jgi:hypothetical protein